MAITSAICNSYKKEVLEGVHDAADTYKVALYSSAATMDKTTTAYSATNEISGTGYTAGGVALTGFAAALSGDTAFIDFNDPSWASATFTARGCLIYNSSKGNKAVAVLDFGGDVAATNGTFTVQLPAPADTTALVRVT